MLVFIVFEIAMVTAAIKRVLKMSKTDSPLAPEMQMAVGSEGMYQQAPMMGQMQTPVMGQPQAPVMNQQPVMMGQAQAPVMNQQPVNPVAPMQQASVQQAPVQQTPVVPVQQVPVQEPVVTQTPDPGIYNPNPVFTPESIENK